MLNLNYKGTAGGLIDFVNKIASCASCEGKGYYNVLDGDCVSGYPCSCWDITKAEKINWEVFVLFTPQRIRIKKLFQELNYEKK